MASFTSTGISYLVRHSGGGYYWQAKIEGKSRRGSLRTKSQTVAKARLGLELAKARARFEKVAVLSRDGEELVTVGEWIDEWVVRETERVGIKDQTRKDYRSKAAALKKSELVGLIVKRVRERELLDWWRAECGRVSPVTANQRLRVLKLVFVMAVKSLGLAVNPAAVLKRVPVPKKLKRVVEVEVIRAVAASIRRQGKRHSIEAAAMVEVAAFTGMRPAEVAALSGEDLQGDWLAVRGGPEGTKNRRERLIPINSALAEVIEREGWRERVGRLFTIASPYRALRAACIRLEFEILTPYDLRHFFATTCIERGVDLATVADWVGHQDGGVLLLKTYTHVRKAHSAAMAAGLRFG
jgi:integrase